MNNQTYHATPTTHTVELVAAALNTISSDVDPAADVHQVSVTQSNGAIEEVSVRETRPQVAFEAVRSVLDTAKSNDDIKRFVDGLRVTEPEFKANEPEVRTHCFIALSLCRDCETLISENNLTAALEAALGAREYAAVAYYLAVPQTMRLPRILKVLESERGRANIRKHPHKTNKAAFTEWATKHIQTGATPKNCPEIKRLPGFNATWGVDETIKKWWRAIPGAPALKSGASRTQK